MFFKIFFLFFVCFVILYKRAMNEPFGIPLKLFMLYFGGYCVYTFIVI